MTTPRYLSSMEEMIASFIQEESLLAENQNPAEFFVRCWNFIYAHKLRTYNTYQAEKLEKYFPKYQVLNQNLLTLILSYCCEYAAFKDPVSDVQITHPVLLNRQNFEPIVYQQSDDIGNDGEAVPFFALFLCVDQLSNGKLDLSSYDFNENSEHRDYQPVATENKEQIELKIQDMDSKRSINREDKNVVIQETKLLNTLLNQLNDRLIAALDSPDEKILPRELNIYQELKMRFEQAKHKKRIFVDLAMDDLCYVRGRKHRPKKMKDKILAAILAISDLTSIILLIDKSLPISTVHQIAAAIFSVGYLSENYQRNLQLLNVPFEPNDSICCASIAMGDVYARVSTCGLIWLCLGNELKFLLIPMILDQVLKLWESFPKSTYPLIEGPFVRLPESVCNFSITGIAITCFLSAGKILTGFLLKNFLISYFPEHRIKDIDSDNISYNLKMIDLTSTFYLSSQVINCLFGISPTLFFSYAITNSAKKIIKNPRKLIQESRDEEEFKESKGTTIIKRTSQVFNIGFAIAISLTMLPYLLENPVAWFVVAGYIFRTAMIPVETHAIKLSLNHSVLLRAPSAPVAVEVKEEKIERKYA